MADKPGAPGWNTKPPKEYPTDFVPNVGRVGLNLPKYDLLIKQQGAKVLIYRTTLCPNVKSIDGAEHELECQICRGSGWVDLRPVETIAFIQAQKLDKKLNPEGFVDNNSVMVTFQSGLELQYFTRMDVCDHTDIFYERVKRSQGAVDVLKYKALRVNIVLDANGTEYFQGNDFDLDPNGSIKWKAGRGPDASTIYSIHYEMTVSFRAIDALHVNRFVQDVSQKGIVRMAKAPEQWLMQKIYLVDRKDRNGDSLSPNLIRDPDESE